MKLKNKIIFILLLLFLFIFPLSFNHVNAVEYDGQLPAFSSLVSQYSLNNYCIWTCDNITYLALTNDSEFIVIGGNYWCLTFNGVVFKNIDNEWVLFKEHFSNDKTWDFPLVKSDGYPVLSNIIHYCNIDIKHDLNNFSMSSVPIPDDYVFFQITVVLVEEVQELPKAMVKTLKVIIPVGLVLLGIILLIYLIKRVIYLSQ